MSGMVGKIEYDAKGIKVVTSDSLWSEPTLAVTTWRVNGVEDPYRRMEANASVQYVMGTGTWRGNGFTVATDRNAEDTQFTPIKAPKGRPVYRDGQWVKR